jgi:hypothetical protein
MAIPYEQTYGRAALSIAFSDPKVRGPDVVGSIATPTLRDPTVASTSTFQA